VRVAGILSGQHTTGVSAVASWTLGLLALPWLALGSLTVIGARRRGQRWRTVWLSGLLFPLTWVVWYLVDQRPAER
jgi:hypothetical protein